MYLGCTMIKKENLNDILNYLKRKNISRLDKNELEKLKTPMSNLFEFKIKEYPPSDIDKNNITDLLDSGYLELISSMKLRNSNNIAIIIDNYQTGSKFNRYLQNLQNQGACIINIPKADEKYAACKIASLVARISRKLNIETINNKYRLKYQNANPEIVDIIPDAGAPSNSKTILYLKTYRILNPYAHLPPFVRTKWNNVISFEQTNPRKIKDIKYECIHCNEKIDLIYVTDKKYTIELKSSKCKKIIDRTRFQRFIQNQNIVIDTSAIVSKIISKDLNSDKYFQNTIITIIIVNRVFTFAFLTGY